jgi:hypothetical protein
MWVKGRRIVINHLSRTSLFNLNKLLKLVPLVYSSQITFHILCIVQSSRSWELPELLSGIRLWFSLPA